MLLDTAARLCGAVVAAFVAIALLKSRRGGIAAWSVRLLVAIALIGASLWIVLGTVPLAAAEPAATLTILATAVLVGGLAAEELIGADVRRILGL